MKSLRQKLLQEGFSFEFFQAVRLLEGLSGDAPAVGGSGPVRDETVKLRPSSDLAFPPGDIKKIEARGSRPSGRERWRVTQNFMGLYGVNSPLPPYVAEMIAQGYQDPDPLRDFLDLFNHRLLGLYYRAWKKHHVAASSNPKKPDRLTTALCAMIGQEPGADADDWVTAPQRLVRYVGLLGGRTRSAAALEAMISDYFGVSRVKVSPFLPKKVRIRNEDRTVLGSKGRNNRLGVSVVLGSSVNDVAGQFRLSLGPLSLTAFERLQPGERSFNELVFIVQFFCRRQLDFELELILKREDVKPLKLSSRRSRNALGRHSWLGVPKTETVSAYLNPNR